MSWHNVLGHDDVVELFRRALSRGRLASSFLFVGTPGAGKCTFAVKLAQTLLCQERPEQAMDPCETCPSCVQVLARSHPDLDIIGKPEDKSFLPLELLIGDKEHRRREGLCHNLGLKPFMGGRKVAIIDDADLLNEEGANCLLKTLEEPPPRSVLILVGTSPAKQLPTIRSRCQLIRFRPLSAENVAELLTRQGIVGDPADARRLAAFSEGGLQRAAELMDAGLWTFRDRLYRRLAEPRLDAVALAREALEFVEEAGTQASAKRNRLRQMLGFTAQFYRSLMRELSGDVSSQDRDLAAAVQRVASEWRGDETDAAACLDRSLEALEQVDRNAHPANLIDCWAHDLGRRA